MGALSVIDNPVRITLFSGVVSWNVEIGHRLINLLRHVFTLHSIYHPTAVRHFVGNVYTL